MRPCQEMGYRSSKEEQKQLTDRMGIREVYNQVQDGEMSLFLGFCMSLYLRVIVKI